MILMLLNVHSKQFTKSHLSGGLYKISIRTDLDLDRKISTKILRTNAKVRFPIIRNRIFTSHIGQILPGHILLLQVHCSKLYYRV